MVNPEYINETGGEAVILWDKIQNAVIPPASLARVLPRYSSVAGYEFQPGTNPDLFDVKVTNSGTK
jgi:hypothetical protein